MHHVPSASHQPRFPGGSVLPGYTAPTVMYVRALLNEDSRQQ